MTEITWKKIASCESPYGTLSVRFNRNIGEFELFDLGQWCLDEIPGDPNYTYYIPEVQS